MDFDGLFHTFIRNQVVFSFSYVIFSWLIFVSTDCAGEQRLYVRSKDLVYGDDLYFHLTEPEEISYYYKIRPARNFGVPLNTTIHNIPLVLVNPPHGCSKIGNELMVQDNIAFVVRGDCSFVTKSLQAEAAGARAIIIYDREKDNDDMYIDMIHDGTKRESSLPAFFLLGKNGWMIRQSLEKMKLSHAVIHMPINITGIQSYSITQPPWTLW